MIPHGTNIKLFAGNANPELAKRIADTVGLPLSECVVSKFSDGEISVSIGESVRGADVFLIQSTSDPVNNNIMEMLIMIDALKRASAGRITTVIPYFGYARQDRKSKARDAISAKLIADLIETAGAHRVLTMDLHASQLQGFFDIPVDNLMGISVFIPFFMRKFGVANPDLVCIAPDLGSAPRVRKFSEKLQTPIAIIDKVRQKANVSEVMNIIGNVKGKEVLLIDDMIDTAGTLCNAAEALVEIGGATAVYACATHGVLSGPAIERLEKSVIKEVYLLDTIQLPEHKRSPKITQLSVTDLFSEAIKRIYEESSVSELFN